MGQKCGCTSYTAKHSVRFVPTARNRRGDPARLLPEPPVEHCAMETSVAAPTGQWVFGGLELVSVDQWQEGWVWSYRMWVHVPASGGSLPQELPGRGGGGEGRLPGTQAAWLSEERNRHPKDSKCSQMGKVTSDWGAR